jgi:tetratricopeptide (TPR) repeat protein
MRQVQFDLEILYVYKLYYFLSLFTFFLCASFIVSWRFNLVAGGGFLFFGFIFSYMAMIRKKSFPPPDRKLTAQKMAREITQNSTPLAISRFASQLYFYFHEPRQAIPLLEKYLDTQDPLLCATLADILLREGHPRQALGIIRENQYTLSDPLLLATQGHILQHMGKYQEAIKIYERSLRFAHESGFPHNGANRFTQLLLTLSYTASIHHSLGDCYLVQKDYFNAKKHFWSGNIRFFDITLWRKVKLNTSDSPKNYKKSH